MGRKTTTSNEVVKRYKDKTYDKVTLTYRKEDNKKQKFQEYAKSQGLSLNQLVIKAVNYYIEQGGDESNEC